MFLIFVILCTAFRLAVAMTSLGGDMGRGVDGVGGGVIQQKWSRVSRMQVRS